MKIKELLQPVKEQLEQVINTEGENEYDFDEWEPHLELMYGDTYHHIDDMYWIVEDDGDVVLRVNTDHLIDEPSEKFDEYRMLEDITKVIRKYDKAVLWHWDDEGIHLKYDKTGEKMYDEHLDKELDELDKRIIRIQNILQTPRQNMMTDEKERSLQAELKFCHLRKEQIYNDKVMRMKLC